MTIPDQPNVRRLRAIVIAQGIAGVITFVPLLLLAGIAFGSSALMRPENLVVALWSATAVIAAAFNIFGGVVLYFNPRRRIILGSFAASAVLLAWFIFGLR